MGPGLFNKHDCVYKKMILVTRTRIYKELSRKACDLHAYLTYINKTSGWRGRGGGKEEGGGGERKRTKP